MSACPLERGAPLLPLLRKIHAYPTLPSSLDCLTFPELLLDRFGAKAKERELRSNSALFGTLNRLIQLIQENQTTCPALIPLKELYKQFIESICTAHGEDRIQLLTGPARLFALLSKEKLSLLLVKNKMSEWSLVASCPLSLFGKGLLFQRGEGGESWEKIFPKELLNHGEFAPLLNEGASIEELSPLGALQLWSASLRPIEATFFERLSAAFPDFITSQELLHSLAEKPNREGICFLVSSGANPNQTDRRRRTALHRAAQWGQVENGRALISVGGDRNQCDLDGQTPLHLAAIRGDREMVEALLELGCDPELITGEKENLLHLAAHKGEADLITYLLSHPLAQKWINQPNSRGERPLHRALQGEPKIAAVHLLVDAMISLDLPNQEGETPLHYGAKYGHLESVRLLLKRGARMELLNQKGQTPFDLAIEWGQDQIVWLVLGGEGEVETTPSASSSSYGVDGQCYRALEKADASKELGGQLFWLQKLAQLEIERKSYFKAAHLLNGAIALIESASMDPLYRHLFLNRLERVEALFLWNEFGKRTPDHHHNYLNNHRQELQRVRGEVAELLKEGQPIELIQERLTRSYQIILSILIDESIALLAPPSLPPYAVIGLGSMARKEMCPYSDLEFAFLIPHSSGESLSFFRALSQLIALKMVNMGETKCDLIRGKRIGDEVQPNKSFVKSGFSMDIGGICPAGKEGIYELIGTPEELAHFQTEEWLRNNDAEIILVNAMRTVCFVKGDSSLIKSYEKIVSKILNKKKLRERRAIELMQGYFDLFKPRINGDKIELRAFNVKQELYRLPQSVISGLALFYGLKSNNAIEQVDELYQKRLLSLEGSSRLKQILRSIFQLRVETHLFYKAECETLYHPRLKETGDEEVLFEVTPLITETIFEIYRTLIPLHESLGRFLQGDRKAFSSSQFYDPAIGSYDDQKRQNLQFDDAFESATRAAALNPNNPYSRQALAIVQSQLGQSSEAVTHLEEALALLRELRGRFGNSADSDIATTLMNFGLADYRLGEYPQAVDYLRELGKEFGNLADIDIATILMSLGSAHYHSGDYLKAVDYLTSSLEMRRRIYGTAPHPDLAAVLTNLGLAYLPLGEYQKAIDSLELALKMSNAIHHKKPNVESAAALNNLGLVYKEMGNYPKALEFFKKSLAFKRVIYGNKPHIDRATTKANLGETYRHLGRYPEAIKSCDQALELFGKIYPDRNHPDIASVLHNKGLVHRALEQHTEEIDCLERSLAIKMKLYSDQSHMSIALTLNSLATAYFTLGNFPRAIEKYTASFEIKRAIYGDRPHPSTALTANNLGLTYMKLNEPTQALPFYIAALEIYQAVAQPDILKISDTLDNIIDAYWALSEYQKVIDHALALLELYRKLHGDRPNLSVARTFQQLGASYQSMELPLKAIEASQQSLEMYEKFFKKERPSACAVSLLTLGSAYRDLNRHQEAVESLKALVTICKSTNKEMTKMNAFVLRQIGKSYRAMGQLNEAAAYFKRSYAIYVRVAGAEDPGTLKVQKALERLNTSP